MKNVPLKILSRLAVYDSPNPETARLAASKEDWDTAAAWSETAGCPCLFYANAKRHGLEDRFSENTLNGLRRLALLGMAQSVYWHDRFYLLARHLLGKGIAFVPLKGLSLRIRTYGERGIRPISDMDLLIPKESFEACRSALGEIGFRVKEGQTIKRINRNPGQEVVFVNGAEDEVDLHFRLFPWYEEKYLYGIDSPAFLKRKRFHPWKGLSIPMLSLEDEFLYLLHCAMRENAFRYLVDADAVARVHGAHLEWDEIARRIAASPVQKKLGGLCGFLKKRLETPMPVEHFDFSLGSHGRDGFDFFRIQPGGRKMLFEMWQSMGGAGSKFKMLGVFIGWQLFKSFGFFRNYFEQRNNPVP